MSMKRTGGSGVARNDAGFTAADAVVHVSDGVAAFVEALENRDDGTFVADIRNWDEPMGPGRSTLSIG